jgi:DNA-binding CsgD family transcriptional regulator
LDRLVYREFVVAAADVLNECVSSGDHPGAGVGLQTAHRPQSSFQLAVVGFDAVVRVPLGAVPGSRSQLVEHPGVDRGLVGDDLDRRDLGRADRPVEEPASRFGDPPGGHENVDDLPERSIARYTDLETGLPLPSALRNCSAPARCHADWPPPCTATGCSTPTQACCCVPQMATRRPAGHSPGPRRWKHERGDAAAARGPFVAAVDIYAAMGASWAAKRLRARFRAHGMRPPTRRLQRPAVGWEALTPAEAKVAELVAAGRSNPEIAEELMLSRHTVLTHVARVLAKLQVRSRVDVARAAADRLAPAGR